MPWISIALGLVEAAPTVLEGLQVFVQHLHNEMTAGGGQTNPVGVTSDVLANVEKLAEALLANVGKAASE